MRKHSARPRPGRRADLVERILAGEVDLVVNTPSGRGARADGYEIRAAAVAMDRPIITTVQELAAAVQGIEALGRGSLGVRSLQDWTAALHAATARGGRSERRTAAGRRARCCPPGGSAPTTT